MVFKPGQSGNPKGTVKSKPWRDALRVAINDLDGDGKKYLRAMAEATVKAAAAGDMQAIKEIGDRLDGKPVQALANDDESPLNPVLTEQEANERLIALIKEVGLDTLLGNEEAQRLLEVRPGAVKDKDQDRVH